VNRIQERRLREVRSRVLIRAFAHRQRRHAAGVWFRLRRILVDASEAHAISTDDANRLIAEGYRPEPVGHELAPPRVILILPPERVSQVHSARRLPVRLSAELLSAECLALVPFEKGGRPGLPCLPTD
jgi:hypothetical protein